MSYFFLFFSFAYVEEGLFGTKAGWTIETGECLQRWFDGNPPSVAEVQRVINTPVFRTFEILLRVALHDFVHCVIGNFHTSTLVSVLHCVAHICNNCIQLFTLVFVVCGKFMWICVYVCGKFMWMCIYVCNCLALFHSIALRKKYLSGRYLFIANLYVHLEGHGS